MTRDELVSYLAAERETHVAFLQGFLRCRSANPPGDCVSAAAHVLAFLGDAPSRIVAGRPHLPNVVGSFQGGAPGRHLVLNGHIDVFPAFDEEEWSGAREDGRLFGRGAADMKAGTAAAVIAYRTLYGLRDQLHGRLTLTAVADEQTGGRWGTRYLFDTIADEITGDCLLNGEPSGINNIRFMEKGTLRLVVRVAAPGGHGGYPHLSRNPNKVMAAIVAELEQFHGREADLPDDVRRALTSREAVRALDEGLGEGASRWVRCVSFNPGVIEGGLKVNQIPHECRMEAEFRIPAGIDRDAILAEIAAILARHDATWEVVDTHSYPPSLADPGGEMVRILQRVVHEATGTIPVPVSSLGGSDSRYWRYAGVPAYLFGPSPIGLGGRRESVAVHEYLTVVRAHTVAAFDYLTVEGAPSEVRARGLLPRPLPQGEGSSSS